MIIALGARVHTSDGEDLGTIDRLILDPTTSRVKAAVISKGILLPNEVEVPLSDLLSGPEDTLYVPYTADQVHSLPQFEPAAYTTPPVTYGSPEGYPPQALYWPASYHVAVPYYANEAALGRSDAPDPGIAEEVDAALRRQDLENAVITEGSAVIGRDGQKVGELHQLHFDPHTRRLTSFVVRKGFLFGKDEELPVALIARVDDGVIYLTVATGDPALGALAEDR
jgi:sporulation protein YlmC with PRC-barrel domain